MHECPCCGDDYIYSDDPSELCRDCKQAGCEPDDDGEYYGECNVPTCHVCETKASYMTDNQWHPNCEPEDCEAARNGECKAWAQEPVAALLHD